MGRRKVASPPLGNPRAPARPLRLAVGKRQPYMLLPSGNFPPGAPPGPGEGVRSASEKKPARGRNPPPGCGLPGDRSLSVAGESARLSACCCRGSRDAGPAGPPLTSTGTTQGSRREAWLRLCHELPCHSSTWLLPPGSLPRIHTHKLSLLGLLVVPPVLLEYICLGCSAPFSWGVRPAPPLKWTSRGRSPLCSGLPAASSPESPPAQ